MLFVILRKVTRNWTKELIMHRNKKKGKREREKECNEAQQM